MKDNFSLHSDEYAQFRPGYPEELFQFLQGKVSGKERAWDCGTGNGQVAGKLSTFFGEVYATDISVQQLMQATDRPNIHYSKQRAEETNFHDSFFDLVTVAQAIHWFDFQKFYEEVRRTTKPEGMIAVLGYGLFESNKATDQVIQHFYNDIIGSYWDEERRYLDEEYKSIPFPFREIQTPDFNHEMSWSLERLVGYLSTWSAVKHYEKTHGKNPVDLIYKDLQQSFGEIGRINFPILFRMGHVH